VYGYSADGAPVELVNLRLRTIGIPKPELGVVKHRSEPRCKESRKVYFEGEGWLDTPVYQRSDWAGGFPGPAVVEQYDATTVVYPGWVVQTDGVGDLVLERDKV
jgi:N-methylhydantoinase A